jgi:hypothetical protein
MLRLNPGRGRHQYENVMANFGYSEQAQMVWPDPSYYMRLDKQTDVTKSTDINDCQRNSCEDVHTALKWQRAGFNDE